MGQFESGRWIIALLIYFLVFFIVVSSVKALAIYSKGYDVDSSATFNRYDGNYNPFQYNQGKCIQGSDNAMEWISGDITCTRLSIDNFDYTTCNSISGCEWQNGSTYFGWTFDKPLCGFTVNKTYYNITGNRGNYCEKTTLFQFNESLCQIFGCEYIKSEDIASYYARDQTNTKGLLFIWDTIKDILLFKADIGLVYFDWVFSFIFFYIPFIMLLWAIYMALPLIH